MPPLDVTKIQSTVLITQWLPFFVKIQVVSAFLCKPTGLSPGECHSVVGLIHY